MSRVRTRERHATDGDGLIDSGHIPVPNNELLDFLGTRDATYCFACLAAAFPRRRVQPELETAQRAGAPIIIGDGLCAICQRTTIVVAYVPESPDLARLIRRI